MKTSNGHDVTVSYYCKAAVGQLLQPGNTRAVVLHFYDLWVHEQGKLPYLSRLYLKLPFVMKPIELVSVGWIGILEGL